MVAGTTLAGDEITDLYRCIVDDELTQAQTPGNYQTQSVNDRYIDAVTAQNPLTRTMNIVADYGNGIAGAIGPTLFEQLNVVAMNLFADVDGNFPNHHPDPSNPDNLVDLQAALLAGDAEIGLAFDGDGDRLGIVIPTDDRTNCEIIWADRVLMLLADDVLAQQPGEHIVFDVKCTGRLFERINNAGGQPVMWRTGHSLIKRKMRELDAPLAGEMSGHFFFGKPWHGFDDALYAAARLLSILSRHSNIGELLRNLPSGVSTPELHIHTAEGENHQFIEHFQQQAHFPDAEINAIDGVRADFATGWGLIRASNTTPVLVLRFEADNAATLTQIQQQFKTQIRRIAPQFEMPF